MAKKKKVRWFAREWRKHRGYNLERAAEMLGTTAGYLSDLEKGQRRFNQDHLEAMAEVYNCDPADLIMRDPTAPGSLWSIWDQIQPVDRPKAEELLRIFIRKTGTEG